MKLPDKNTLQTTAPQTPRPQGGIVSVDLTQGAKGLNALGQGLERFGEGVSRYAVAQDHSDYLQAKSALQAKAIELESTLEKDNDYSTYQDRFKKGIEEFKQNDPSFKKIKSGFLGNAFGGELQSDVSLVEARAYERLATITAQKEADVSRAGLLQTIETNSQALLQTSDEASRADIIRTTGELIDAKLANNHINAEQAFKLKRGFAENYALNRISLLSPQQQIDALNPKKNGKETYFEPSGNFADVIPAEKKVALYERAKDQIKIDSEKNAVDLAKRQRLVQLQSEENAFNHLSQGGKLSDITPEQWFRIDKGTQDKLKLLERQKAGLSPISSEGAEDAYYKYQELYANDPKAMAEISPIDITTAVGDEYKNEVLKWRADAIKNVKLPASDKIKLGIENDGLKELGINNEKRKKDQLLFRQAFNDHITAFQEQNGRKPSIADLEKIKDKLAMKVTVEGLWSDKEMPMYQIDKKKMENLVVPETDANNIIDVYQKQTGKYPTTERVKEIYLKGLNE